MGYARNSEMMAHYTRVQQENQQLRGAVVELQNVVGNMHIRDVVNERVTQLRQQEGLGFPIDEDDYRKASNYAREHWDEHLKEIQKRPRNHDTDQLLPIGETPAPERMVSNEERAQVRVNAQRDVGAAVNMSRFDRVVQYVRDHPGTPYEKAQEMFDKNGNLKKTG